MARRLSKRRLQVLQSQGQDLTQSAGPAITSSVGHFQRTSDNSLYTSELTLDLGNSIQPCSSYTTAGMALGLGRIIGASSSVEPHQNAQLCQGANPQMGYITSVELICAETPTGGATEIGLYYHDVLSASNAPTTLGTEAIAFSAQTIGDTGVFDADADVDGMYWYLASTGSTSAEYSEGKFIVRWYGYKIPADI